MASDASPEHLLDVFRTAALSVTKLYKSSITAQKKARAEGYQDCLDDLLQFLDKEHLGLNDGEGWKIRAWANERLDNGDVPPQLDAMESDDDSEKQDPVSSPEIHRSNSASSLPRVAEPLVQPQHYLQPTVQEPQSDGSRAPAGEDIVIDEPEAVAVPSRDTFDFVSSHVYPQDVQNNLNLGSLRLSDSTRPHEHTASHSTNTSTPRKTPRRHGSRTGRSGRTLNRGPSQGPRTGSKRPMDFEGFFPDLKNLKEFGLPPSKRRHL